MNTSVNTLSEDAHINSQNPWSQGIVKSIQSETLNDLSSDFFAQFVQKKQSGNALCMRLKAENDEGAIQRHASTFDYGNYKVFESLLASMNSFEYLLTANDDLLEAAYREYFEPQTSKYYLWTLLGALDHAAFKEWFFSAHLGNSSSDLSESLLAKIKIAEKICAIQKKIASKNT